MKCQRLFGCFVFLTAVVAVMGAAQGARAAEKGMTFQAIIRDANDVLFPGTPQNVNVTAQILGSVSGTRDCVLFEEDFSSVSVKDGYLNLVLGHGTISPSYSSVTFKEVFNNKHAAWPGLTCYDNSAWGSSVSDSYTPSADHARKVRLIVILPSSEEISAVFNLRSSSFASYADLAAEAQNSQKLNNKDSSGFLNTSTDVTQIKADSLFNTSNWGKLTAILGSSSYDGSGNYTGNIAGSAATATTAGNVTGIVAIANGGTGATTQGGAINALLPSQGSNSGKVLSTDGTNVSWSVMSSLPSQTGNSGKALKTDGTSASWQSLADTDIPNLDAAKITSGTFGNAMISGLGIEKLINATAKYFNYKPNNIACGNNEVLKYDSTLDASNGGWKCATDDSGSGSGTVSSGTTNQLAYYGANGTTVSGLTTANNSVLVTDGSGVPTLASTLPTSVQANITQIGTLTTGTWNGSVINAQYGGTGVNGSGASNGQLLIGNGSGFSLATLTAGTGISVANSAGGITLSPDAGLGTNKVLMNTGGAITANNLLVSNGTATGVTQVASTASGVMISSGSIPSWVTQLGVVMGGTGATTKTAGFDNLSPSTSKGDLIVHDGTNNVRVPAGTNGYVLTADSAEASGLKWAAASSGGLTHEAVSGATLNVTASDANKFYAISSGATVNLPAVAGVPDGFRVIFKRTGASAVTLDPSGAETIEGESTKTLPTQYYTMSLVKSGSMWLIDYENGQKPAEFSLSPASATGINPANLGSPSSCTSFSLTNTGEVTTAAIALSLTLGGADFELTGCTDNCTGQTLAAGASCSFGVRAKVPQTAGTNAISGTIQASASGVTSVSSSLAGSATGCPSGFIGIPALSGYSATDFCVAKYEMRNNGSNVAISQSSGSPWVSIQRGTDGTTGGSAWKACKDMGANYDLISNAQWQTIARNIADTASNWSTGTVYSGELNRGHSDNSPASALAATVDSDPCNGTGQSCNQSTWDSQRRTHTLSNGVVIWDFAGNVSEWVKDNNGSSQGASQHVSQSNGGDSRQTNYGNDQFCASPTSSPYCGMGVGRTDYSSGAVLRGGLWNDGIDAGVFASNLYNGPTLTSAGVGFRCVWSP